MNLSKSPKLLAIGASLFLASLPLFSAPAKPDSLKALHQKLAEAQEKADLHPLFRHHLHSLDALVRQDWDGLAANDPKHREETLQFVEEMNKGLDYDALAEDPYLKEGKRSFVISYPSSEDQSIQYYSVALPPEYDPTKAYPLVVTLHGSGPSHPLFYVKIHVSMPPNLERYLSPKQASEADVITVRPWGRGNEGYRGKAEIDVFQAIRDAENRFKIDPQRRYLMGHSMGGFGTWRLGAKSVDYWAALLIIAGGARSAEELAPSLSIIPVRIWHGEEDQAVEVDYAYRMRELLRAQGNEPSFVLKKDWGHGQPEPREREENLAWLLKHRNPQALPSLPQDL